MAENSQKLEVTVTDLRMPFWSMVVFMLKWAFASIPALVILVIIGVVAGGVAAGGLGVLSSIVSAQKAAGVYEPGRVSPKATDPSGIAGSGKIYLDWKNKQYHEPGCEVVATLETAMAYDRDAAEQSGYKPHECVKRPN